MFLEDSLEILIGLFSVLNDFYVFFDSKNYNIVDTFS